jgi:hypothetical protein
VRILALDFQVAREIGVLLARVAMSVTDAAVCHAALAVRGGVIASDPSDIRKLIPESLIEVV